MPVAETTNFQNMQNMTTTMLYSVLYAVDPKLIFTIDKKQMRKM